jgi:NAD(P)H dehydrogenase (quinone)
LVNCGNSNLLGNIIKYLFEKNYPPKNIITTVRSLQKGEKWKEKGIEIRIGDYKYPESLEKSFKGVDRLYMVSSIGEANYPRSKQHLNVIEAAKKCNVKLIVYSGFLNCQNNTKIVANDHKYTEKILEESGLNYSIARNASYINCSDELFKYLMKKENYFFYNSCKDTKIVLALIRELDEAGACILLKKEPKKIYELTANTIYIILI